MFPFIYHIQRKPRMFEISLPMFGTRSFLTEGMIEAFFLDCDQDTIGSESLTSFDTAEQSLVSRSEVFKRASLSVRDQNPERLALAVEVSHNKNNQDTVRNSVIDRVNRKPLELKIHPGLP